MKMFDGDSVAVVTGGTRGIGRAVVKALAAEGVRVFFTYRQNSRLAKELSEELQSAGGWAQGHEVDVSNETQVRDFFRLIRHDCDRLDVLVNSAGIARDGLMATMSVSRFKEVIEVNVVGAFLCGREAMRIMATHRTGSIVFISSALSHRGGRGQTNYCASKGALWSLTHALALEAAPYGVRVNSISPGFVDTDMTKHLPQDFIGSEVPLGRLATAAEIARAVVMAASPQSAYMTGSNIVVDGGLSVD